MYLCNAIVKPKICDIVGVGVEGSVRSDLITQDMKNDVVIRIGSLPEYY